MNQTWWYFIRFLYSVKAMSAIILTGPKHSGKTSAGKALASLNSCRFIDLDESIFQNTGKTPRQLFTEGISIFKQAETEACLSVISNYGNEQHEHCLHVIAAGGGIIDNPEAAVILKNSGVKIVYLNISTAAAWARITSSKELPPFLQTDNPQETHRVLHERRAAAYRQFADIVIEAEGKTPDEIAGEICELCRCKP